MLAHVETCCVVHWLSNQYLGIVKYLGPVISLFILVTLSIIFLVRGISSPYPLDTSEESQHHHYTYCNTVRLQALNSRYCHKRLVRDCVLDPNILGHFHLIVARCHSCICYISLSFSNPVTYCLFMVVINLSCFSFLNRSINGSDNVTTGISSKPE